MRLSLGPERLTTTIRAPSGDQRKRLTPFFRFVRRFASPPLIERRYTCERNCSGELVAAGVGAGVGVGPGKLPESVEPIDSAAGLVERNASHFPSGLQRGELQDCELVVNCQGVRLPSTVAIQIAEFLLLWLRSIFETTYATNLPSAEICGSLKNSKE